MTYFIETKNLILRDFRDTDVTSIFQLDSNREVHEYLGKKPIKTIKEAEKILSFFAELFIWAWIWVIEIKKNIITQIEVVGYPGVSKRRNGQKLQNYNS